MRRPTAHLPSAVIWLCLTLWAFDARAQSPGGDVDPLKVSEEITQQLARRDIETAIKTVTAAMALTTLSDSVKASLRSAAALGESQYFDLVYARDYGRTGKDIIYKINFEQAFLFGRYLFHIDGGRWRLINFKFKTENDAPFPKEWQHIYP
ncbi:MAG: hypothetical protein M3145_01415 [Pseudomonadota bacterium]|nr:hypothetical protein [Pseudomonadota bacterium]